MADINPLPPPEPTYRAIEATLASHEPGRRFLAEHARRSRHEETTALLEAVARLHERAADAVPSAGGLGEDLPNLRDLTASAEASLTEATSAPTTESDVFDMVERIQETAWTMRESGGDASLCDLLDSLAGRLSRACRGREQRDLALDRAKDAVGRLSRHLAGLDSRLAGPNGPTNAREGEGEEAAGPADLTGSAENVPVAAPDPQPPAPTRSKRKSRSRSAGPDLG